MSSAIVIKYRPTVLAITSAISWSCGSGLGLVAGYIVLGFRALSILSRGHVIKSGLIYPYNLDSIAVDLISSLKGT